MRWSSRDTAASSDQPGRKPTLTRWHLGTWAECDIRRDPLDRLVLRHDSFLETPWHRAEHPFRLEACLQALREQGRSVALDLKEGGKVIDRVLGIVATMGFDDGRLWLNGSIEVLCEPGIRRLAEAHPEATISVPVDFLGPLLLAAPALAGEVLDTLRSWGVNRLSLDWRTPAIRELMNRLEERGWEVNVYGVPDLEAFLDASLLLPRSVTADFNFPDWALLRARGGTASRLPPLPVGGQGPSAHG